MTKRYQPELTYRPPGTSMAQANTAEALANTLDNFRRTATAYATQAQAEKGAVAGAAAGVAGDGSRKSSFTAYGRAYNSAAENAYLAQQNIDVEQTFSRLEDESQGDPEKFTTLSAGYVRGLLKGAPEHLRPNLELLAKARGVDGARRVNDQFQTRVRQEQRVTTLEGLDVMVEQARRLATQDGPEAEAALGMLQEQIVGTIATAVNESLFTPEQGYELKQGFIEKLSSQVSEAQVQDAVSRIMGGYQADILAGDKLLAALDGAGYDDATATKIRTEVRGRLNLLQDERKRAYVQELGALHQDLADGVPSADAEQQAFRLYRRGALETGQYQSLLGQIEGARVAGAKKAAETEAAQAAYDGNQPLDPKDSNARKAMDALFADQVTGVERGSPAYQNYAVEMARRTNIVPSDAVSWARTVVAGDDPAAAATASQFLRRLEDANPSGFQYVEDAKLKAFAAQVNDAVAAGTPPDVAVRVAQRNTFELNDATREAFRKEYSDATRKLREPNPQRLRTLLTGEDRFNPPGFAGTPSTPRALQMEFDASVERYYPYTGGDLKAAQELAFRDVRRTWGLSTVNGQPELLKYAPEAMFPGLPVEVVRADIEQSVAPLGLEGSKVSLVPSPATGRTGGRQWYLGTVDEFGAPDIVRDASGKPLNYVLPIAQEDFERVRSEVAAQKIAEARAQAAANRERNKYLSELAMQSGGQGLAPN